MLQITSNTGKTMAKSHNLAVFSNYERRFNRYPKLIWLIKNNNESGLLVVTYDNGDQAIIDFNSYSVMKDWVARRRNWNGIETVER